MYHTPLIQDDDIRPVKRIDDFQPLKLCPRQVGCAFGQFGACGPSEKLVVSPMTLEGIQHNAEVSHFFADTVLAQPLPLLAFLIGKLKSDPAETFFCNRRELNTYAFDAPRSSAVVVHSFFRRHSLGTTFAPASTSIDSLKSTPAETFFCNRRDLNT